MNREQQVVLSLLKEIDAICRKYKIEYYLSPRLALCGETGQSMPKSPLAGRILMKVSEMERFCKAFEEERPERRALESLDNNKYFPGFFLYYVNMDTLCFRMNEEKSFEHMGFGVEIHPLRSKITSSKRNALNRTLELGWRQLSDNYRGKEKSAWKEKACGVLVRGMALVIGRKRISKWLYKQFCKNQSDSKTSEYIYRVNRNLTYYFSSDIFADTKETLLENETFLVPGDAEGYLKKCYGANYREHLLSSYVPSASLIVNPMVSYEDYFKGADSVKGFLKARKNKFVMEGVLRKKKEYFNWCWEYAKFCASRKNMANQYIEKKDYIRNLYENGDYMRLETVFAPYTRMMRNSFKENEIFVADEEIFDIYLKFLEKAGKPKLRAQIEKYRK